MQKKNTTKQDESLDDIERIAKEQAAAAADLEQNETLKDIGRFQKLQAETASDLDKLREDNTNA